jgi:predicted amidophosphoribosyltransferase
MTQDEIIEMAIQAEFVNLDLCSSELERFAKLVAAKAIAELESQEPVCPECKAEVLYECVACSRNNYPPQRTEPKVCCQQYDTCLEPCTPRGEHLAQRTWVGLTDEEKKNIFLKWYGKQWGYTSSIKSVMNSVEAKLKQKNGFAEEKNS